MQIRQAGAIALGVLASTAFVATPVYAQMVMSTPQGGNAQVSRPGDIWTGGGLLFAPRYLSAGSGQVGVGLGYLTGASPATTASPLTGELGIDYAVMDGTEIYALLAPVTLVGVRSQLMANDYGSVGWDLNYRADFYPDLDSTRAGVGATTTTAPISLRQGLTAAPIFGGLAMAQGAELRIDAEQKLGPVDLYATPKLAAMSIGLKPGLGLGLDLDLGRLVLGYNIVGQANVSPASSLYNAGFQLEHGLGGRVVLTDNLYIQANWYYIPQDDLYNTDSTLLAGIGYQWGSSAPASSGGGMIMSQ